MPSKRISRESSHAGSWYSANKSQLNGQLDKWLDDVNTPLQCIGPLTSSESIANLPVAGARVIIGPHAGYSYSGPAAAYAYKSWDVSKAKRIFLLGPSHHVYLNNAALSKCTHYSTPLGDLKIDAETTQELHKTGQFGWMNKSTDEDEHSLEMHLPYIYKILSREHGNDSESFPPLIPIMVGSTSARVEKSLGETLAPFLSDPTTALVISSDFAHWGSRFRYTYYQPQTGSPKHLTSRSATISNPSIHESIKAVDFDCIEQCESGSHDKWLDKLEDTGNTVCGRHPIGVIMAAIERIREQDGDQSLGSFKFVRYERSSLVNRVDDSSVSYASAFAVL